MGRQQPARQNSRHERRLDVARILIIEDSRANMKLTSALLSKAGHIVLCAVDAEVGVVLAHAEQPDLILLDIQLPGMDGMEAATLLKHDPATGAIPIIAVTAMPMSAAPGKIELGSCDAYIAKPLHYQELLTAIAALLIKRVPPPTGTSYSLSFEL